MSWQQFLVRSLRAASSASSKRGSVALSCMQRSLPSNSIAATCGRSPPAAAAAAAAPSASLASVRAFQSSRGLPFSAASLLQQSKRSSQPSFPPSASTQAISTSSSCSVSAGTGGEGAAGSGLIGEGEDDEETLKKEPRTKPRPKEPPDPAVVSTESTMQEMEIIPGSSPADGEHIFFLSRHTHTHRLSREATAHLHHIVQVRESKLGALPRLRVGKEGLKKAFLASVADSLQAHGVVKVQVPKNSGLELGFVAFCLEASQDCIILGQKGNTLTAYRDTSLPRPPSTYADSGTTFLEHQQRNHSYQQHPASPQTVMHNRGAHEQHVLQQLAQQQQQYQQQQQGQQWTASGGSNTEAAGGECKEPLPALKRLDGDDELEEEQAGTGLRQLDFDDKLEGYGMGIQAGAFGGAKGSERPKQRECVSVARASAAFTADVEHRVTGMRGCGDSAAHGKVGGRQEQKEPKSSRSSEGLRNRGLTPKPKPLRFNLGRVVG
ncbi:hypothetical protein DUNSADRAFT_15239 [Dunaliella salina]|uniref:CRM domain-containing protein n=1 Tax=Dunaliella salina TaxID=3046 RepID=A0ABQ7H221_DUNSA|nr:hypothetical protein DUNSADRAFT_15239 [Dunaliella salina]|eukprot:KAF5840871.1 hypothetical protein DUNSADRAFT_15239 [Dunaliella salina]